MIPGFENYDGMTDKARAKLQAFYYLLYYRYQHGHPPLKSYQIEAQLGISGTEVRAIRNLLQSRSVPIVSMAEGYAYDPSCAAVQSTVDQYEARCLGIQNAVSGLKEYLRQQRLREQGELFAG